MFWKSDISLRLVLLLVVGLTSACAPQRMSATKYMPPFPHNAAVNVFAVGYGNIVDKYIKEVAVSSLALDGLRGLSSIDPELTISRDDEAIILVSAHKIVGTYALPDDNDVRAWAKLTTEISSAGRNISSKLQSASAENIYKAVFDGTLSSLDKFSRYASAKAARKNRIRRGGFGGVGIHFKVENDVVLIKSVMPDTPAARAGIKAGDIIIHVGDVPVRGLKASDIGEQLRGHVYSTVRLTVSRSGAKKPLVFTMKRERIILPTVSYGFKNGVVSMKISSFNQDTSRSLAAKMEKARHDHAGNIKGMVLDMRGNPGGLLKQSIKVADLFLASGDIINTIGRNPGSIQNYEADISNLSWDLPVVVLVDGKSASAAEVTGVALQDQGRAVVIGTSSYGKGTVQTVIRLPNNGEITLTWSRLIAPSGYAFHRLGILPSICTSGKDNDVRSPIVLNMAQISKATLLREKWRKAPLSDQHLRDKLRSSCPAERHKKAFDMNVASRLLANHLLYNSALDVLNLTAEVGK